MVEVADFISTVKVIVEVINKMFFVVVLKDYLLGIIDLLYKMAVIIIVLENDLKIN